MSVCGTRVILPPIFMERTVAPTVALGLHLCGNLLCYCHVCSGCLTKWHMKELNEEEDEIVSLRCEPNVMA